MSSDIKKNPGAIPIDGTNDADIGARRKITLGDYLKASTKGYKQEYTDTNEPGNINNENPISSDKVTINPSQKNYYPIEGNPNPRNDKFISNVGEGGIPIGISNLEEADRQTHFTSINQAKEIYNQISSDIFFDKPTATKMANDIGNVSDSENFKGTQEFGHQVGSEKYVKIMSEQVSSVLLKNRFSPPEDYEQISSESSDQRKFNTVGAPGNIHFNDIDIASNKDIELQKLGAVATLAASGYSGNVTISDVKWKDVWDKASGVFQIENIMSTNIDGVGLDAAGAGSELNAGSGKISDKATNPTKEWILSLIHI